MRVPPPFDSDLRLAGRAELDDNPALVKFADTLEMVCIDTVEAGFTTRDLALLVGDRQGWLTTESFLGKVDENLKIVMNAQTVRVPEIVRRASRAISDRRMTVCRAPVWPSSSGGTAVQANLAAAASAASIPRIRDSGVIGFGI